MLVVVVVLKIKMKAELLLELLASAGMQFA